MPFTFFAHQTVVIPLKWAKPRWFDGTALCIGSMAPDFAYALEGTPLSFHSHNLPAQFTFSLPFALLTSRFFRARLAEPIGAQLPGIWGAELRALAASRHALWVSAVSALLGGLSHLFLDGLTHAQGWAVLRSPSLRAVVATWNGIELHLYGALQYFGHTFGTLLGLYMVVQLVRRRQFARWNGIRPLPCLDNPDANLAFVRAGLASAGFAMLVAATGANLPIAIIRGSLTFFVGLALTALRAHSASSPVSSQAGSSRRQSI